MTTVTEEIDLPANVAPANTTAILQLVGTDGEPLAEAYDTIAGKTIAGQHGVALTAAGTWSLDLTPNANLLPAGTAWRRTLVGANLTPRRPASYATVPTTGTPRWDQILTDPPASIASAALTAFQRDEAAVLGQQALGRVRAELARSRAFGQSCVIALFGDSNVEAFSPTKRGLRWGDHLARRLNGELRARSEFIPASANTLSSTNPADWPGGQMPWTYSATPATAPSYGPDLHAVTIPAGANVQLTYYGDLVAPVWTGTPDGPAAAAVTLDGVPVGTIDAQDSPAVPGKMPPTGPFGTIGDHGAHTLQITATGAPLTFEGALVHDGGRYGFGLHFDAVEVYCFGHAGFRTQHFVDNTNWATSFAKIAGGAALVVIALGANDLGAGVTAATYRDNLVTIMQRIDAAVDAAGITVDPRFALAQFPGLGSSYVAAAWEAAAVFDADRCTVRDLAALLPDGGGSWGTLAAADSHANDAGQLWLANTIADFVDPGGPLTPVMPVAGPIIEATDEPTRRSNWALLLGASNAGTYDETTADTAVHERRHRTWLEAGTYAARLRCVAATVTATAEVLVGSTSLGTLATGTSDGNAVEATLAGTVTIDAPGWYPVTIRKTATGAGPLRFARLHLRRIG